LKVGPKEWCFVFILAILLITDLTILLNISFLRQILGFLFLTILPGLLILQILKLNKIDSLEKFILIWGLSISFLMFFGLLLNQSSLGLGYETPLSTFPLLITFNIAFIIMAIIGYKVNKERTFSLPNINLSPAEKAFLTVPILFPALSILGMHVMNTTDNNIILMFLLFLIPIYVAFVCFFNRKFPKRMYPVVIFLISISLLLLLSLRSNHLIGMDVHHEYHVFRTTLDNQYWSITGHSSLDACLAISLLPTIYQLILNISPEFLFKILYSSLYSVSPLVIYVLSKKYVGEPYAFLASFFFMSQQTFLWTEYNARTNTAILFFALAMMTLFNDKIDPLKKRILFIVFMASCLVSHYSTTYIFFFIILGTFIGVEILSKKYTFKKIVSLTIVVLFFVMIFLWYSQVTGTAFNASVNFIEETLGNLNRFFMIESRAENTQAMLGAGIMQKGIPHKMHFVFTWLTFVLIGIGITTLIRRYKEMSFPEMKFKKPDFLKDKFEVTYFMIALACSGLLVVMVALPRVSGMYSLDRLYAVAITILSVFFVIGGITLAKILSFKKNPLLKKQKEGKNASHNLAKIRAYLIILLVLIPYFFCVTGVMYNIFGVQRAITLNSKGEQQYDQLYVHDQESDCAEWLGNYRRQKEHIYTANYANWVKVMSQGNIMARYDYTSLIKHKNIGGYIYLGYYNVVNEKLLSHSMRVYNMTEYSDIFAEKSRIYDNGGSEVWR